MSGVWAVVFLILRFLDLIVLMAVWAMLRTIGRNQVTQAALQVKQARLLRESVNAQSYPPAKMMQGPPLIARDKSGD